MERELANRSRRGKRTSWRDVGKERVQANRSREVREHHGEMWARRESWPTGLGEVRENIMERCGQGERPGQQE